MSGNGEFNVALVKMQVTVTVRSELSGKFVMSGKPVYSAMKVNVVSPVVVPAIGANVSKFGVIVLSPPPQMQHMMSELNSASEYPHGMMSS